MRKKLGRKTRIDEKGEVRTKDCRMIGRILRPLTTTREKERVLISLEPKLASLLAAFLSSFPVFLPTLTHSLCFVLDSVQREVTKGKNMQKTSSCPLDAQCPMWGIGSTHT